MSRSARTSRFLHWSNGSVPDIVVRRGDDVATRIRQHFPGGVDGLADGAALNELVIAAVGDTGAFTSVRGFEGEPQRGITFSKLLS